MKGSDFFLHLFLAVYLLLFVCPAQAAPGEADPRWTSLNLSGEIVSAAAHPDQGVWIAGNMTINYDATTSLRIPQSGLIRLFPSGLYDSTMNQQGHPVEAFRLLPDSNFIRASLYFYRYRPTLQTDLSVDWSITGFNKVVALLPDRSYLIGRNGTDGLVKISTTGLLDSSYAPGISASILALAVQPDGTCYAAGQTSDGKGFISRISPAGVKDPTFSPVFDGPVNCLHGLHDGRLLAGGRFTTLNSAASQPLVRFLPDGTLDLGFNAVIAGPAGSLQIKTLLPQSNGAVLISGTFDSIHGIPRPGMGRLLTDGSLDTSFGMPDPTRYGNTVKLLGLLQDGRVLADVPGDPGMRRVILLQNDPGSSTLTLTAPDEITLTRFGGVPALAQAWFEHFNPTTSLWEPLGPGTRTVSGWRLQSAALPTEGIIRVMATGPAAHGESAGSFETQSLALTNPAATFTLQREDVPLNTIATNGISFGEVWTGSPASMPMVLRNTGTAPLSDITFTITGPGANAYAIVQPPPATLPPGASAQFALTFTPATTGSNPAAALTLATSNSNPLSATYNLYGNGKQARTFTMLAPYKPFQRAEGFTASGLTLTTLSFPSSLAVPKDQTITLVDNISRAAIIGSFEGMPQGSVREFITNGTIANRAYQIDYTGGDGNDITLRPFFYGLVDPTISLDSRPGFGLVHGCIRQRNGGLLAVGDSVFNNRRSSGILRFHPDGSLDEDFLPEFPRATGLSVSEMENGKLVMTYNSGTSLAHGVLRLFPDGQVDTEFSCNLNDWANGISHLPDGRMLIVGRFTSVNGQPRTRLALIGQDGNPEPNFTAAADNHVYSAINEPNGSFLISGRFAKVNGISVGTLAQLNSDGSLNSTFSRSIGGVGYCLSRQADNTILCGGDGFVSRFNQQGMSLGSWNTDLIENFQFSTNICVIPQANGRVIIGSTSTRGKGVIRMNSFGKQDSAFSPDLQVTGEMLGLCLEADGNLMIGGKFEIPGNPVRKSLVRVQVEEPVDELSLVGLTGIRWLRGGSLPDSNLISFALYNPVSHEWMPLGPGTYASGVWSISGLNLPPAGAIRATARVRGGRTNSSHYFSDSHLSYGGLPGDLTASLPNGTAVPSGTGVLDFGIVASTYPITKALNLDNKGAGVLNLGTASISGPDASSFSTLPLAAPIRPAGTQTSLTVRLNPTSPGPKTAVLTLTSDDPDQPAYQVNLQGIGADVLQTWRALHFASTADTGNAANSADPDGDGLANLAEYALGLIPTSAASATMPQAVISNGNLSLGFTPPANISNIRYSAEASSSLDAPVWTPLPDQDASPALLFTLPQDGPRRFLRLRFTVE